MKHIIFLFLLIINHCSLFSVAHSDIFKEYDIRGVVGEEFTVEDTSAIAAAIATYFHEKDPSVHTISVGADGRVHSPSIKLNIIQSLREYGFDVLDIGICTTPVMYFSVHTLPVDAGLMITASHNPGEYNGIKICYGTNSVSGEEIKKIRDIYLNQAFSSKSIQEGNYDEIDLIARYVDYFVAEFPDLIGADINAIIDCGNGAAGTVMPLLAEKMQWKTVKLLYAEVDGSYPHHIADPTVEKYMLDLKEALANSTAAFGLGFDGDVDRMAPMTKSGKLVKGDQLVSLFSKPIIDQNPGSAVVFDVSSSRFLHNVVKKWGGTPVISKTGVACVKKAMADSGALIGGEISCHTVFKDRYFGYDDGIYSMMRLFEFLKNSERSLESWLEEFPLTVSSPTYRLPCKRSVCFEIIEKLQDIYSQREDVELITVDGLRLHFPQGWGIVRASNTEPLISMRFEGQTKDDLDGLKKEFYEVISQYIECSALLN